MDGYDLREIWGTLAESQDIGLVVKMVQSFLDEGREKAEVVHSDGRLYRIEGKLLPSPHIEITPIDN